MITSEKYRLILKILDAILKPTTFIQKCVALRNVLMREKENVLAYLVLLGINRKIT